jgi:hypothetical protein
MKDVSREVRKLCFLGTDIYHANHIVLSSDRLYSRHKSFVWYKKTQLISLIAFSVLPTQFSTNCSLLLIVVVKHRLRLMPSGTPNITAVRVPVYIWCCRCTSDAALEALTVEVSERQYIMDPTIFRFRYSRIQKGNSPNAFRFWVCYSATWRLIGKNLQLDGGTLMVDVVLDHGTPKIWISTMCSTLVFLNFPIYQISIITSYTSCI